MYHKKPAAALQPALQYVLTPHKPLALIDRRSSMSDVCSTGTAMPEDLGTPEGPLLLQAVCRRNNMGMAAAVRRHDLLNGMGCDLSHHTFWLVMQVEIDLSEEGDARRVSRRAASLVLQESGQWHLSVLGRFPLHVNGSKVSAQVRIESWRCTLAYVHPQNQPYHVLCRAGHSMNAVN